MPTNPTPTTPHYHSAHDGRRHEIRTGDRAEVTHNNTGKTVTGTVTGHRTLLGDDTLVYLQKKNQAFAQPHSLGLYTLHKLPNEVTLTLTLPGDIAERVRSADGPFDAAMVLERPNHHNIYDLSWAYLRLALDDQEETTS